LDAYSPYPVHGIEEALGIPKSIVPRIALTGALCGIFGGFGMQWWMNSYDYPINVAGRNLGLAGWPTNIPITFESAILLTAISIFFGSMALFGLPRPYHPVFESEAFRSASLDAYWISVESEKLPGDLKDVEEKLRSLGARRVETVRGPTACQIPKDLARCELPAPHLRI
ncbi:MAG: DUF3341 domain-containing protein, partial [Deltaproteobacteria bacterium]|nr:DUF3341 domain-containing protein [Deltaproteobacteria bacterium]